MPRRRANVLLPLEAAILEWGLQGQRDRSPEFHGFDLARKLDEGSSSLTAHGTLYKALERLEERGLLTSRWESDDENPGDRPRRRLYRVTADAAGALALSHDLTRVAAPLRPGVASS